jgi:hypothetical protein
LEKEVYHLTAQEIIQALKRTHPASHWACVTEMRSVGYKGEGRKIDLWALSCATANGMIAHSYEVKVSRSDWLSELKKPLKRRMAMAISNQFWFVAPKGVIKPEEVPHLCGLIEMIELTPGQGSGLYANRVLQAEYRDKVRPTWAIVGQMARSFYRTEIELKNEIGRKKAGNAN